jgi:hypothetical protein
LPTSFADLQDAIGVRGFRSPVWEYGSNHNPARCGSGGVTFDPPWRSVACKPARKSAVRRIKIVVRRASMIGGRVAVVRFLGSGEEGGGGVSDGWGG